MATFTTDLNEIRSRARRKIEEGAVTEAYKGDVNKTVDILNDALATEIVCVLRYMHHYFMATGVHAMGVRDEFKEHADAEREHADKIADRVQQLGGKPDFNPQSLLQRSASQYAEGKDLADMVREDLIAERIVIEVYSEMIRYFGNNDPTTRIMIEAILADEEEHASDLSDLLYVIDPRTGKTEGQDPGTEPMLIKDRQRAAQGTKASSAPEPKTKQDKSRQPQPNLREHQPLEPLSKSGRAEDRPENRAEKNWKLAKAKNRKPAA
ncbi:MAG TPA: ferritin-like domain-containing protein [Terriglobales bacterium]|nr:ferritin-like domain-containing protein [Terriglobales bacterium]